MVKHSANSDDSSDDEFANSNCYYSMSANRLRDEEKEEIIGLASIQRNNPAFVTVLKKKACSAQQQLSGESSIQVE